MTNSAVCVGYFIPRGKYLKVDPLPALVLQENVCIRNLRLLFETDRGYKMYSLSFRDEGLSLCSRLHIEKLSH